MGSSLVRVNTAPTNMFKLLVLSLVASAFADSVPQYGAPPPYHAPVVKYVEEKLPPQPYAYEYGVADDYSHSNFQKTTYTADPTNGFVAEVSYSGEAIFPPAPA